MIKKLSELALLIPDAKIVGADVEIGGIEHDSRKITAKDLFVCMEGAHVDGHNFIGQAVDSGAVALLTARKNFIPPENISALIVPDMLNALAVVVPYFYDYPSRAMRVVGITGTNGKTTTTYLLRKIFREAGLSVGLIGTIQILIGDESFPNPNTTPNVIDLQHLFAKMREKKIQVVVMEVSSHALAENRVAGVEFDTAIFTNLTQDHLDFHGTMENYLRAKTKLFDAVSRTGRKKNKTAVINVDDAASGEILRHCLCKKISYGVENSADLRAMEVKSGIRNLDFVIETQLQTPHSKLQINSRLSGIFNVYNILAACGAALAENISPEVIKRALEKFHSVPGRFERISSDAPFAVIVDYAHTPDGVKNVLETARQIATGKILTVFGCGGDRDHGKRPIMGRLAAEFSDVAIATSDNPRTEDPEKILDDVERGVRETIGEKIFERITDRRAAIFRAIELAEAGDVVLILGKGHENYQILSGGKIHFDDREVARDALKTFWRKIFMNKLTLAEVVKVTGAETNSDAEIIFEGVTTDSRKVTGGVLFVALKGEVFNGEDFAEDALKKGAAAVLVSRTAKEIPSGVVLKVDDTLAAYRQIAGSWRERFDIPIVAVTGSNGKTTTKDLTAAALNALGHVQKTSGNFNNEVGVPMTLLELTDKHDAAVVEIGMRGLGQIETLARVVKPTIGIVTNVSETHIELLGSIENIARAKGELVEAIQAGGTIILNADNFHTLEMKNLVRDGVRVLTYSLEGGADFVAKNILIGSVSTEFVLDFHGKEYDFEIPMLGRHNVSNALGAIAAGYAVGLTVPEIQRGFSSLTTTKMRYEVIRRDGLTIINDAYNASPASMRAAIRTTSEVYNGRLIAVLGDMLELGNISERVHREIGEELVENKFDTLITLGELGKFIADGARDAGMKNVCAMDKHEDAAKKILELVRDGDTILFKASHAMHMEKIIELI